MVFRTDEGDPIFRPTASVDEPDPTPTSTPTSGRTSSGYVAYRESERYEQDVAEGKISGVPPPEPYVPPYNPFNAPPDSPLVIPPAEPDPTPVISDAIKTIDSSGATPSGATTPDPALVKYLTSADAPSLYDSGLIDPSVPAGIPPATYKAIQEGLEKTGDVTPFVQTSNLSYGSGTPGQVTYAPPPKEKIEEPLNWFETLEPERGIDPSPYAKKYGYFPDDPDYDIIRDSLTDKMDIITSNIDQVGRNIEQSTSFIDQINTDIAMVQSQPGKEWTLTGEGFDPEKLYSSGELLDILESKRIDYEDILSEAQGYSGDIPGWEEQRISLSEFKKDMDTYEKLGYEVDILEDDSIQVGLPPPSEVHDWYVGEGDVLGAKGSDVLLGATSFFESPLAVRTATDILSETAFQTMKEDPNMIGVLKLGSNLMFGGGQLISKTVTDWWTGSRDVVPEHTKERLSEFSLDLSKTLKEGGGLAFGGKVLSSPAMIEGVYIPLATLGTGYITTGLSGTATTGSSALATFGKTTGGKITRTAIVGTGLVVGGAGITMLGSGLYDMAQTQPEALPGALSEVAFTFGMAYGGYKTGEAMWKSKHTGSWKYDWQSDKAKWDPREIPQPKDVKFVQPDVLVGDLGKDAFFTGRSGAMIGDKPVDVWFKGVAHKSTKDPRFAIAEGEGWVTQTKTKTFWGKQIGEVGSSHRFTFKSPSVILGQKGQESIYFNVAESQLVAGQPGSYAYGIFSPTRSKGLTWTHEVGDLELIRPTVETGVQLIPDEMGGVKTQPFAMFDADIIGMKQFNFLHSGKYTSGNIYGNIRGMGRMFTYDLSSGGSSGVGGGGSVAEGFSLSGGQGGLLSKVDMGGILDVVGGKISTLGDSGASASGSGSASGSAGVTMASGVGSQILHSPFQSLGTQSGGDPVSLNIEPVQAWGGLVSIFAPPETIQKGGQRSGRGSGRRSISILGGAQAGELDIDQDMGELKGWGYKPAQEPVVDLFSKQENELGLGIGLDMGIGQIQYQEQQQDLSTVSALNFFAIQSPLTFRIFDPTPITGYPTLFPIDPITDQRGKRRKKTRHRKQRISFDTHQMDKGLLSDLASVTRSHGKYGIATHPKLTKEIWDIGEKTMFMHVPTVELMMGKKKKKKTKKNLDITNRRMSDVLM